MELGRIFKYVLRKDDNTSWVIDSFDSKSGDTYRYDTLKLDELFSFLKIDTNAKTVYYVSLYVKRSCDNADNIIESKLTLSKIKKTYAEGHFYQDECDATDDLMANIIEEIKSLDVDVQCKDVMFEKSIKIKAQGLSNFCEKGKVNPYYIVGMQVDKRQ
jgi:hypothetical protein